MHDQANKYLWLLTVTVVITCSAFAASATNHYLEATYLTRPVKQMVPIRRVPASPRPHPPSRTKDGDALVNRNMFCSECQPSDPEPAAVDDGDQVPQTTLPLRLVATSLATRDSRSFATIRNTSTQRQGAYWLHHQIPGAGPIETIRSRYVDFRNQNTQRLERIALLAETPHKSSRPEKSRGKPRTALSAAIDEGIHKINNTHYQVDRDLVDRLMANPMAVGRGARIVPSVKNRKPNGFKLYAIRPNSIYAKLGLRNGDTIHAVNGFDLTTPDKMLEVYTKVKESSNLSITMSRRGKPVTLSYNIR